MNLWEQKDRVSAGTNSDSAADWVGGQLPEGPVDLGTYLVLLSIPGKWETDI